MHFQSDVKTILFITSSRIGDAVLSSGLLKYVHDEYPNARVTICCGPLAVSLFEGYPMIERIIPITKQKYNKHWYDVWRQIGAVRFDMVIDLRNSIVSRLVRAQKRYIYGSYVDKQQHKVIQNASVMKLPQASAPHLWFTDSQKEAARSLISEGAPVLAVGPTANWIGKTWAEERFIEIIQWMTDEAGNMAGARVAVFAAPGEEDVARRVLATIPTAKQIDVIAKTDPGTAAAALSLCDFYIGNDSGLMHCAAAVGVPTVGLFGPSYPNVYAPWGDHASYVSTPQGVGELTAHDGYNSKTCSSLMGSLTVDMVKEGIQKKLAG
tara:strand:- start:13184 stop:14152 length:969 start_codon:yes stop_codon:yes gene_type:complete